jgi:hypothetical protein
MGECTTSVSEREGCAQRTEASERRSRTRLGFALMIEQPGKVHQVRVENHG